MFQPSFKLESKSRIGSKVKKKYHAPETPCARLINDPKFLLKRKSFCGGNSVTKIPFSYSTRFEKHKQQWLRCQATTKCPLSKGTVLMIFFYSCRDFGSSESQDQHINPNRFARGTIAHVSIHSKAIGQPFSNGYRRNLTLLHQHCWSDFKHRNRTSMRTTKHFERCNEERIGPWRCIIAKQLVVGTT